MQKEAPSIGRIVVMVTWALSCIGLLLFLWISFGGVIPMKAKGYRVKTHLPETVLLTKAADIRMAGLDIGNITKLELSRDGGQEVEIEIEPEFAPLPADTRILARQKSILGQLYLELTPGTGSGRHLDDGATIPAKNIVESVELDEIVRTFNKETRDNFRGWIREIATAISNGRSEDLSNAIGNLDDFAGSGARALQVLDEQEPALRQLVRNTGITLNALTERRGQLRELIVNANGFFEALASRDDALAETIGIFPTFLEESRLSLDRLRTFATDTRPLVRDLIPVALQLRPTLHDLGELSPDLKAVFRKLDPVISESGRNLPAAAKFVTGAKPLFGALHSYLPELNPILSFANYEQEQLADFIMNGGPSVGAKMPGLPGEGPRHYGRQFSNTNARSLGLAQERPNYERGNAYPAPNYLKRNRPLGITESFDCKPAGGEKRDPEPGLPPCFVQPPQLWDSLLFPRLERGDNPVRSKPQGNDGTRPARLP
ncbi:MAG TPA: MlaD family protein [Thermoleophilaceae bacterium]|jgi:virulence factor Mce-like protein